MQSACCAIDSARLSRGFTLLELVIVVALLGLMASMVGVRVASTSVIAKQRDALQSIASVLASVRVDAMRSGQERCAALTVEAERFVVSASGLRRSADAHGIIAIDEQVEPLSELEVCFDASGRTRARLWWFISDDVHRTELLNANLLHAPWDVPQGAARDVRGQVWRIVFDPVSGAPRVERADGNREDDT